MANATSKSRFSDIVSCGIYKTSREHLLDIPTLRKCIFATGKIASFGLAVHIFQRQRKH